MERRRRPGRWPVSGVDEHLVIGIDAGTTAVKAVAFALDGTAVMTASRPVAVELGFRGAAECDMAAVWDATAACVREITGALSAERVVAVGVTGQGDGLWLLDADGEPVRPAPCWMDGRAGARAAEWAADGRAGDMLAVTGTPAFAGSTPVLFAELAEDAPGDIARAAVVLYCKDWIRFRLTGSLGTDYTEASRALLDLASRRYCGGLASRLGVERLRELLPEPAAADCVAGQVTAAAAAETGLRESTPVATGLIDVASCGLGVGAREPGDGWVIVGTTACVGVQLASSQQRRVPDSMVMATGWGSGAIEFLVPASSIPNLDWARKVLGMGDASYAHVEALAREAGAGAGGVVYLPYGAPLGERAPFLDADASAAWVGLGYATTPGQALRAVYEGIAAALVECIDLLQLNNRLIVTGGGARSDLLCQILADMLARPVVRCDVVEAGALGAAMTALMAIGRGRDIVAAADAATFTPERVAARSYAHAGALLRAIRESIRPHWSALRASRNATETVHIEGKRS